MRLVKMTGGLGNQMFIYAFYLQMKRDFPDTRIDLSDMMRYRVHYGYELHRIFPHLPKDEVCMNATLKKVIEFLFFRTVLERKQDLRTLRAFRRKYFWPLVYFKGIFQDVRYFQGMEDEIRAAFAFDETLANERTRAALAEMDAEECAVSLHVRRGDYLDPKTWRTLGCVCRLPYYRDALRYMEEKANVSRYYVFSDDLEWVKKNLPLDNAVYVTWNRGEDSWQDMLLMSRCRHHIICNSTFAWWGAWLGKARDGLVVAPARWFATNDLPHICPPEWHRIPVELPDE